MVIGDDGANPQPILRVGNVVSGNGTATVSPIVFQGETARNIEIVYTTNGPMYDSGTTVDSRIQIGIPTGLTPAQTDDPSAIGFITVSRVSGTVLFRMPNNKIVVDPNGTTATIDVTRMEANAKIYVAYRKVTVEETVDNPLCPLPCKQLQEAGD